MEADFAAFGSPLCGEVKRFCRRVRETYREIKEDLTPYRDDRYYRYAKLTRRHQASQSAHSYFSGSFTTLPPSQRRRVHHAENVLIGKQAIKVPA